MRRREVIALLGGAAVPWPLAARAQPAKPVPRIGMLTLGLPVDEAFRQGLRDPGYVEGQNLVIEYRGAAGKTDRLAALAA